MNVSTDKTRTLSLSLSLSLSLALLGSVSSSFGFCDMYFLRFVVDYQHAGLM